MNEKDFTKERLIEIAKDLAIFIAEECLVYPDVFDCLEGIGLTIEETEFLLGCKKEEEDD